MIRQQFAFGYWPDSAERLPTSPLIGRLRRLGLGWTAGSWTDYPELVETLRDRDFQPTAFGRLVRDP